LRYWDVLLKRYPNLLIDECASGGRRNDIETLRRSVPLWKSDTWGPDTVLQNQTYGLALWIPFFGTGTNVTNTYQFRSSLGSSLVTSWDVRDRNLDFPKLRELNAEFWRTAEFFVEDYYPLTEYNPSSDTWMAWQFNRRGQDDGIIQAFRREKCGESIMTFRLNGLNPAAQYEVINFDLEGSTKFSGSELMETGLTVEIKDKPGAAVISYKELK
jgi:alpha-galactosidase